MARFLWNSVAIASVLLIAVILSANCDKLEYSNIRVVEKDNSSLSLTALDLFNKIYHVKGNIIFSKGQRIAGDELLSNHLDSEQFSQPEDVEVFLHYPAADGKIITFVEVLADPDNTYEEANTGFVKGKGGINKKTFDMIVQCKRTEHFAYEVFIYGY